jgi:hypothetical protein
MTDAPNTVTVVQQITTIWSKETRGAHGREVRARLPQWYPLKQAPVLEREGKEDEHSAERYAVGAVRQSQRSAVASSSRQEEKA